MGHDYFANHDVGFNNSVCFNTTLYPDKTAGSIALGTFFCVGLAVTFVPQFITIGKNKSSKGVSLLFAACSATMAMFNVSGSALLSLQQFNCCPQWGFQQCCQRLLPLYSLGAQSLCTTTVYLMVIHYRPKDALQISIQDLGPTKKDKSVQYSIAYISTVILCIVVLSILFVFNLIDAPQHAVDGNNRALGNVLSATASVITCVQFIPQVVTTYQLKTLGSFSAVTLILQSLGGIGYGAFLFTAGERLVVALPPVVCSMFQLTLLFMQAYYKCSNKRKGSKDFLPMGDKYEVATLLN